MRRVVASVLAIASFSWFAWDAKERGWSRNSTDFPNYYTAARLARTRQPLQSYYDWIWFQRQIHYAGIDDRLGGYIPQTPLTMAPFVPLSFLSPLAARRAWFVLNFLFLGISLRLISSITRFTVAELWLLSFLGYATLRSNFELGQYYIFLLALMTLAICCLLRKRELAGGVLLGAVIALKLYAAPFLLLAAARKRWRAVSGICLLLLLSGICAEAAFGWKGISFYTVQVLPRALKGETLNPYHPSNGSAATLLRRLLVFEPGLNPKPPIDSPAAFVFLAMLFALSVTAFPIIAASLRTGPPSKRTLAWWLLGMLLVSPNTASYTFALLILPVALLLDDIRRRLWAWLLAPYFMLTLPLWPLWSWAFPKVWLLLALFLIAGWPDLKLIPMRVALITFAVCGIASAAAAIAGMRASNREPRNVIETAGIYSSLPTPSPGGLLYDSIGESTYVIRQGTKTFAFDGDAFHPSVPDSGAPIYFELVKGAHSSIMRFDGQSRQSAEVNIAAPNPRQPAISHDGKTLAFVSREALFAFDGHATRRIADSAYDPSFVPGDR